MDGLQKLEREFLPFLQEVKAAILLGSRGVDLPGIQHRLQSLHSVAAASTPLSSASSAAHQLDPLEPLRDTDIAGFLRNERENALLAVLEETRRETFEQAERMHWETASAEWEAAKRDILQAMGAGVGESASATGDVARSLRPELSRLHESTLHQPPPPGALSNVHSSLDAAEVAYAVEVTAYNAALASALSSGTARYVVCQCMCV